jgi:hypothetical protein
LLLLLDLLLLRFLVRRDIGTEHERSSRLLKGRRLHVQLVGKLYQPGPVILGQ